MRITFFLTTGERIAVVDGDVVPQATSHYLPGDTVFVQSTPPKRKKAKVERYLVVSRHFLLDADTGVLEASVFVQRLPDD